MAGNHLRDTSSLLRNIYQTTQAGNNVNTSDLEFKDPAILAVGKGRIQLGLNNPGLDMRSNFVSQTIPFESDPRVQLLMQRSLTPKQNLGFSDGFNHVSDSYGFSSRLPDQSQVKNLSPYAQISIQQPRNGVMSNSHWDSWSNAQNGTNIGIADLLRNDRWDLISFIVVMKILSFGCLALGIYITGHLGCEWRLNVIFAYKRLVQAAVKQRKASVFVSFWGPSHYVRLFQGLLLQRLERSNSHGMGFDNQQVVLAAKHIEYCFD